MSNSLLKRATDAVWPRGAAWVQKVGGGMEALLLGLSDSLETVRTKLATLAALRDPNDTEQLGELEIEYGILPDPTLSDAVRRERLYARKNAEQAAGTRDRMERELQAAGFDLYVHANDPAVNPALFANRYATVAGGATAVAGNGNAIASFFSSYPLVNGAITTTVAVWRTVSAGVSSFAGNVNAVAGQLGVVDVPFNYTVPADPDDWPLVFFVGGLATRDGSGALVTIEGGVVPLSRKAELEQAVLRLKPLHSWAIMAVNYT